MARVTLDIASAGPLARKLRLIRDSRTNLSTKLKILWINLALRKKCGAG